MKKTLSILLLVCILVVAICVPATAAGIEQRNLLTNRATAGDYRLIINGVSHYVPSDTYVGYNYITTGYYVGVAQKALNSINTNSWRWGRHANCSAGTVDEIFVQNTYSGVFNFQAWDNYWTGNTQIDGICGPATFGQLANYLIQL